MAISSPHYCTVHYPYLFTRVSISFEVGKAISLLMELNRQIKIHYRAHDSIRHRRTGTPAEFARRLGVGRATLYRYLDVLRERGASIDYHHAKQYYYYQEPFEMYIGPKADKTAEEG